MMLRVEEVAKMCAEYLADHLSPQSCINVRRVANRYAPMYVPGYGGLL